MAQEQQNPQILDRREVAQSRLFRVEALDLRFSNGEERYYERLMGSGSGRQAVMVVALVDPEHVLMVREYAAGTEDYQLSLPKGLVEADETVLAGANRELQEEAGFAARQLEHLTEFTLSPNYMGHRIQVVLARDLYPSRLPGDEPELPGVEEIRLDELDALLERADFSEGRALAALYLVRERLAREAEQQRLVGALEQISAAAGAAIMQVYRQSDLGIEEKSDHSPVTAADKAAHDVIMAGLQCLTPELPILSEEGADIDFAERSGWRRYWLVDPLDGTKEFINRNGEFTVNIALIEAGRPVLGMVYMPVTGTCYWGGRAIGAWCRQGELEPRPLRCRTLGDQPEELVVVGSRRHGAEALEALCDTLGRWAPVRMASMGSSLKLCLVASGEADLYPRLAPTCEWDTAAAQAVVEAAGGQVLTPDFQPLRYNRKASLLNPFFYVVGDPAVDWVDRIDGAR